MTTTTTTPIVRPIPLKPPQVAAAAEVAAEKKENVAVEMEINAIIQHYFGTTRSVTTSDIQQQENAKKFQKNVLAIVQAHPSPEKQLPQMTLALMKEVETQSSHLNGYRKKSIVLAIIDVVLAKYVSEAVAELLHNIAEVIIEQLMQLPFFKNCFAKYCCCFTSTKTQE